MHTSTHHVTDDTADRHDVSFVDSRDLAAPFLPGQFEGVVSDTEGVVPGDDFQAFHNSRNTLKHRRNIYKHNNLSYNLL